MLGVWGFFTASAAVSASLDVTGFGRDSRGAVEEDMTEGALREAWRLVMSGMMLLPGSPSPATLQLSPAKDHLSLSANWRG